MPTETFFDMIVVCFGREINFNYNLDMDVDMFNNFCQWLYPLFFHIQDASGPFLYGTLNRRPQMTLPRPRSDRLGSEGSSIMNGLHHHHPLIMTSASGDPQLTNSISAYSNQDVWTPIQTHRYYSCLCLHFTMWKFDYFSITQILRKIDLGDCRSAKSTMWTHSEDLNFGIYEFLHFLRLKLTKSTKFRTPKMAKNDRFRFSRFSKIDFT